MERRIGIIRNDDAPDIALEDDDNTAITAGDANLTAAKSTDFSDVAKAGVIAQATFTIRNTANAELTITCVTAMTRRSRCPTLRRAYW